MVMRGAIRYADIPSPLGTVFVASGDGGLLRIALDEDESRFCWELEARHGAAPRYDPDALQRETGQLAEYLAGRRTSFDLVVDLRRSSSFQRAVLEEVRRIPYGAVSSYRDIAWAVGRHAAARAVGSAVATNPVSLVIPCHRVIRSDGTPGEYALRGMGHAGQALKLRLLSLEGVALPVE